MIACYALICKLIAVNSRTWVSGLRKKITTLVTAAAGLSGVLVLFGFLSPWLAAADSVAHFRFHLTAVMALLAALLAILGSWRRAGLAAILSAIGAAGVVPVLGVLQAPASVGESRVINVVQLNLSFRNRTPEAVAKFVRAADADIVTLQEVTGRTGKVMGLLASDYPNRVRCPYARVGGVAVLSRLPRARGEAQGCIEGQGLSWIRVIAGGQELTVASLHLHWPWPFRQHRQIGELEKYLRILPRPVLLAGDFNAAPWSHAVQRVADATGDSVAPGLRFSFGIQFSPWTPSLPIPIDHILLPGDITPLDLQLGPELGSDHRPIVARLALPPERPQKLAAHN